MTDFVMPALGADMEDGTLVEWLVKPGDRVRSGDVIAVVETQKGAIEVEAFLTGEVREIVVPVGQRVPVGTVLARIGGGATAPAPKPAPRPAPTAVPPPGHPAAAPPPALVPLPPHGGRIKVSPAARREAAARGIDLAPLHGTGFDGAIVLADLTHIAPPSRRSGFDPAEMRKAIAAAMGRSKREIPHYYLTETIDLTRAMAWLEARNAVEPPARRLLPAVLLLKAAALALRAEPRLNGTWQDGSFARAAGIHPGWAVALRGGGLVAPAIQDADTRSLSDLMAAMRDLVQRARTSGLRLSELTGGTITITNLGELGAESVLGVIYPPQVAIVGFGRVAARALVRDGRIDSCPSVIASLAADHRVTDGALGGRFLAELTRLLQEPEAL